MSKMISVGRLFGSAGLLALAIAASSCSQDLKDVEITEENQDEISQKLNQELTYEEVMLLHAYLQRNMPELEEGELPTGRSIGEMIQEERSQTSGDQMEEGTVESGSVAAGETLPLGVSPDPEPAENAEATQPAPVTVVVPAGTSLKVRLRQSLSSESNEVGDSFQADLSQDLQTDGYLIAPEGSLVTGHIGHVKASGKVKGRAEMSLVLDRLQVGEKGYDLNSNTLFYRAEGTKKEDAKKIGIGAGAGALIGAITGGKKGAAIGGAVGAGAGTGVVLATAGDEVEFGKEDPLQFRLESDLEVRMLP